MPCCNLLVSRSRACVKRRVRERELVILQNIVPKKHANPTPEISAEEELIVNQDISPDRVVDALYNSDFLPIRYTTMNSKSTWRSGGLATNAKRIDHERAELRLERYVGNMFEG